MTAPIPHGPVVGSLFTGTAALELAVHEVLGGSLAWVCDNEPGPVKILAHRFPGVPNLGDITAVNWSQVEPVDVLTLGFPCGDVSAAGLRAGLAPGTRSGLWSYAREAIRHLRPSLVVIENVYGLLTAKAARSPDAADPELDPLIRHLLEEADHAETLTDLPGDEVGFDDADVGDDDGTGPVLLRALGAVLGDLADLRFDAVWATVAASDVGACHRRRRVFVLAWPADPAGQGRRPEAWGWDTGERREPARVRPAEPDGRDRSTADPGGEARGPTDPHGARREGTGTTEQDGRADPARRAVPYAASNGRSEGRTRAERTVGGSHAALSSDPAPADPGRGDVQRRRGPAVVAGPEGPAAGARDQRQRDGDTTGDRRAATADPGDDGRRSGRIPGEGRGLEGAPGDQPHRRHVPADAWSSWGEYAAAVTRHAAVLGRPAPPPVEPNARGGLRLSPRFVEFMMMLPAGWVTDVPDLTRPEQLRALGNGVVPRQAAYAVRILLTWRAATLREGQGNDAAPRTSVPEVASPHG